MDSTGAFTVLLFGGIFLMNVKRDFTLFLIASALLGFAQSIDYSIFNNFLDDVHGITVFQRTLMELPRELPGFLIVFISGALFFLGDVRMAAIANIICSIGFISMGYVSSDFSSMLIFLVIYSTGQHLFMPISNSIGMSLAEEGKLGKRLGQVNSANTALYLVGSLFIFLLYRTIGVNYKVGFLAAAIAYLLVAVVLFMMTPHKPKNAGFRLVWRKEYRLFYMLCFLYGARKQIFLTFGPWVLIKVFDQTATSFAILGFITAFIGIFFKPLFGQYIDKWGEKKVMQVESSLLLLVFAGYAFSQAFFNQINAGWMALYVIAGCFVADQLLSAIVMARAVYIKKVAVKQEDISPTLSMGISIDHIVSMSLPWVGGFVWDKFGYEYVFLGGMVVVFASLIVASRIKQAI